MGQPLLNHPLIKVILPFAVAGGIFLWTRPPGPAKILAQTHFSADASQIDYRGQTYTGQWEAESEFTGQLQQLVVEYLPAAPFVTHHLVLTTGDFSDPSKVTIEPLKQGKTSWRAQEQPQGELLVLHLIPAEPSLLQQLSALKAGQTVSWKGQRLKEGLLQNNQGGYFRVNNSNHILLLLSQFKVI